MKLQHIKIELTEDEFSTINKCAQLISNMSNRLEQIGQDSIKLDKTTWGTKDMETVCMFLVDLEEECSIE